ncbi:MAG: hypothetical protein RhofKO_11570 [Rhodothermales bacterium]
MRRVLHYLLLGLGGIVAVLGLYTWLHFSPAGATYPADAVAHIELPHRLRTMAEHDTARQRNGGNPYLLEIDTEANGALFYYGASHTQDPNDPQVADITAQWDAFNPTVALYEGRQRNFVYGALIEPFAGLPEPALVHKLARRDDVPLYTLEPSYTDEVAALLSDYPAERIALYFFLRVYRSESGGVANDALALDLLTKRTDVDGLRNALPDLAAADRLWQADFPDEEDWRVHRREVGYLADISNASRRVRGEHMARILTDLVRKGERVFAVVGSGHVIRQEWNLRTLFDQPHAWDQPSPDSTHLAGDATDTP